MSAQEIQQAPTRDPLASLAAKYGMSREQAAATLKATVFSGLKSIEQVTAACVLCNEMGLNPFRKDLHAFDQKGTVQLAMGINGWIEMAQRSGKLRGMEWEMDGWEERELTYATKYEKKTRTAKVPTECTCILHVEGFEAPVRWTTYLDEDMRNSEPWFQGTTRQLRVRSFSQAARFGLGITGVVDLQDLEDARLAESRTVEAGKRPDDLASYREGTASGGSPALEGGTVVDAHEIIGATRKTNPKPEGVAESEEFVPDPDGEPVAAGSDEFFDQHDPSMGDPEGA